MRARSLLRHIVSKPLRSRTGNLRALRRFGYSSSRAPLSCHRHPRLASSASSNVTWWPAAHPGASGSSLPQQSQNRIRPFRPVTACSWSPGSAEARTKPSALAASPPEKRAGWWRQAAGWLAAAEARWRQRRQVKRKSAAAAAAVEGALLLLLLLCGGGVVGVVAAAADRERRRGSARGGVGGRRRRSPSLARRGRRPPLALLEQAGARACIGYVSPRLQIGIEKAKAE